MNEWTDRRDLAELEAMIRRAEREREASGAAAVGQPGDKCVWCSGTGEVSCPICNGKGHIFQNLSGMRMSVNCGRCAAKRSITCDRCKGEGKVRG